MNLIKYELKRLFKSKGFYILLAVCIGLSIISILTQNLIYKASLETDNPITIYSTASIKSSFSGSMVMMIAAIFTAIFVTDEYQTGTIKTVMSKGFSKNQIYLSKYLSSLLATLLFYISSILVTALLANHFFDTTLVDSTMTSSFIVSLIIVIAYHTIYFSISIVTRKLGISIALNIVGPSLVGLVLGMGDALINSESFKFTSYWLDSLLSNVAKIEATSNSLTQGAILGVIYLAIACAIGVFLNKKKEL
jgi:ABC-type transport system involved in multi-copper enzyme maturation permease subunit